MSTVPLLHLASTSPRRRDILETLGVPFEIIRVETDESRLPNEPPEDLVQRLARSKVDAATHGAWVLGADTIVVLGDRVFGKPGNADDGVETLLALAGNTHQVLTGVALRTPHGIESALSTTDVRFREIGRDEALRYWQSGEPADKAGGYGIQGLGGMFVSDIRGSFTGVMGLPVFETVQLLRDAGIEVLADRA